MLTPDFAAYAGRIHVRFRKPRSGAHIQSLMQDFMSRTAIGCGEAGASLIGHIKCIVEADNGGYLVCSATDSSGRVRCRGSLKDGAYDLDLVLNVLLYGLDREKIEEVVARSSKDLMESKESKVEIEDMDVEEHDHDHEHGENHDEHDHD